MPIWRLASWNVNGIRAALKKGFADFLRDYQPDMLGLQEIKISDAARAQADFDFPNYQEFWYPAERSGYSGTAVLARTAPLKMEKGLGQIEFDCEGRVQALEFEHFVFVNTYFPNANHELSRLPYKLKFNRAYLDYVRGLARRTGKPLVLTGDFNVAHQPLDLARPKENVGNPGFTDEERAWADDLIAAGFLDTFRLLNGNKAQYSWWSYRTLARERNIGWRIDYFFISPELKNKVKRAVIWDEVMGSDHAPVGLEIEL